MENVADTDALWLDARIRATWSSVVFELGEADESTPERYEVVDIAVSRERVRVTFRGRTFDCRLEAAAAKMYRQMDRSLFFMHHKDCVRRIALFAARKCDTCIAADETRVVVTPAWSFEGPLDHWLPLETIRDLADELRIRYTLGINE